MQRGKTTSTCLQHGDSGVFVAFVSCPKAKTAGRRTFDGVFGVDYYCGVFSVGGLTDEHVVVAHRHGIMRGEAFVSEKQPLAVGEVLSHAHVGLARQGSGKVHHCRLYGLETHQEIQQPSSVAVTAIADDRFRVSAVAADHAAKPLVAGGQAVNLGQNHEVVAS